MANFPGNKMITNGAATSLFTGALASSLCSFQRHRLGFPVAFLRRIASTGAAGRKYRRREKVRLCSSRFSNGAAAMATEVSKVVAAATTVPSTSVNCYPEYNRLLPCPLTNGPPRIEHLVVLEEGPVGEYISKALDLPYLYVADLIHFGAVYYAPVCPEPPTTATPEQIRLYKEFTAPDVLKKRRSIKGKTVREAQKTFRITHVDEYVEIGTYLRVHVHPKRFPRCYEVDWRSRIVAVTESYVVLDKPAGTSDKMVKKLYLALAAAPVPVGIITHYMRPINLAPRLVSEDYIQGWHLCQLEVLDCKEVPWPNTMILDRYHIEDCVWPVKRFAYQCTINLLTGRTHQIRAQLAACRAPILGDTMYMPASLAEMTSPGINPFGKHRKVYTSEDEKTTDIGKWIAQYGKEPSAGIGLQACQISWDDGKQLYKAGSPWWRCSL